MASIQSLEISEFAIWHARCCFFKHPDDTSNDIFQLDQRKLDMKLFMGQLHTTHVVLQDIIKSEL
jgi:hypothetical protein